MIVNLTHIANIPMLDTSTGERHRVFRFIGTDKDGKRVETYHYPRDSVVQDYLDYRAKTDRQKSLALQVISHE